MNQEGKNTKKKRIQKKKKKGKNYTRQKLGEKSPRGHPDLNQGPLDLQSNALPLSYTPTPRLGLDAALLGVKTLHHQR